jgi:hypothetical protein
MLPLGEDLTQPGIAARRRAEMESSTAVLKSDVAKPDSTHLGSVITRAQESAANVVRMRSSACLVESDGPRLTYRYERQGYNELLFVSGYCPGETLNLWNPTLVPGMSWLSEQYAAPHIIDVVR